MYKKNFCRDTGFVFLLAVFFPHSITTRTFLLALLLKTEEHLNNQPESIYANHVFIIKYFVSANIEKTALPMVPPPRSVSPKGRGCNTNLQKYFFPV